MVTAPTFYNLKDQGIYSAGDFFIPQEKYRAAPYTVNKPTNPDQVPAGIPAVYQAQGSDGFNPYNANMSNIRQDYNPFPSRQAGEIYSKTFNPQPFKFESTPGGLAFAQDAYNMATKGINQGFGNMRSDDGRTVFEMQKEADDLIQDARMQYATEGQFVDPYDPNYSSMTEAQKFMDNYPDYYGVPSGVPEPGIPGAIKSIMENSLLGKGLGVAKDFLGRVMPINERAIMENEARGAGIFTDDIGRIVTDDYNTAGGIMAGYNLNQIDEATFDKRRSTIEKTIANKKSKGLDTTALEERLDLLDEAEEKILGARKKTKQIYKMRADKKAEDKRRREEEKAAAKTEKIKQKAFKDARNARDSDNDGVPDYVEDAGGSAPGGMYSTDYQGDSSPSNVGGSGGGGGYSGRGGGADMGGSSSPTNVGNPFGYMSGGRVYYMDGGLADLVDIYD